MILSWFNGLVYRLDDSRNVQIQVKQKDMQLPMRKHGEIGIFFKSIWKDILGIQWDQISMQIRKLG